MISGKLPFVGESFQEIASQHFNEEPPSLHRLNIGVTLKVSHLVKKMMEKLPEDRFPDYDILLKSLWNLRHVTAPDSSLIPDIHTISIHHLDYNLQKKSYKNIMLDKLPKSPQITQPSPRINLKTIATMSNPLSLAKIK